MSTALYQPEEKRVNAQFSLSSLISTNEPVRGKFDRIFSLQTEVVGWTTLDSEWLRFQSMGSHFRQARIIDTAFIEAECLSTRFEGCYFRNVSFQRCLFQNVLFDRCTFDGCQFDLSLMALEGPQVQFLSPLFLASNNLLRQFLDSALAQVERPLYVDEPKSAKEMAEPEPEPAQASAPPPPNEKPSDTRFSQLER